MRYIFDFLLAKLVLLVLNLRNCKPNFFKFMKNQAKKVTLPHGSVSKIARETGTTNATVRAVLAGRSQNPKVKRALAAVIKEMNEASRELDAALSAA